MVEGIEILDGHMHVFTAGFERWERRIREERGERYREAYREWSEGFRRKYNSDLGEQNLDPPEKLAQNWAEELDRCGVDKAVFVSMYPQDEELAAFLRTRPRRFIGFATVDPRDPGAPALLRRRVRERLLEAERRCPGALEVEEAWEHLLLSHNSDGRIGYWISEWNPGEHVVAPSRRRFVEENLRLADRALDRLG